MSRFRPLHSLLVACLPLAAFGCSGSPSPGTEVPRYTIEQFHATTGYQGASFSPDGEIVLVGSDASGVFNIYALPAGGGEPTQLTHSTTDAIFPIGYFPRDERFLYTSDQGGNELNHIFAQAPDGTVADLTPGDSLKAVFVGWGDDDASFFISTNERDRRFFDLYEYAADGYGRTLLYTDQSGYEIAAVSPDKRYLAFNKPNLTTDSDVYVYDRTRAAMIHLTPHEGEIQNQAQQFSPDGSRLLMTTDEGAEFSYLVSVPLDGGERAILEKPQWDVWFGVYSRHGKYLATGTNNDGRTEVKLYLAESMQPVALPTFPAGDISSVSFARDESRLAMYVSSSRTPRDLYVYDFTAAPPARLTHSLSPDIDPRHLVEGEVVRFASYDGVEIPGILYRPHGATEAAPAPALVWVHGGPGGQSRLDYSPLLQCLINHGYVVYAINNRGSSGYGKTFYAMDDRKHGQADLDDCVAAKTMLTATGWVDGARIGIGGGSYGGYMVLAALAFRPDEFAVGVNIFGVSNWVRTLESIPPWWESFREALYREMGDPETDGDYLRAISPLFHAQNIKKPMIVLQGANDPRVLRVESDEIVEKARANGVPVEYIVFEDEGHGFLNKENRIEGYGAVLRFLDTHLKPGAGASS